MVTTPSPTPPLVWVTHGKTQHPAFLLESEADKSRIRWSSNKKEEWIPNASIEETMTSRRRKRPDTLMNTRKSQYATTLSPKRSCLDAQNGDSDNEIEVLLTIKPPSPMKSKLPSKSTLTPRSAAHSENAQLTDIPMRRTYQRCIDRSTKALHIEHLKALASSESDCDLNDDDEGLTLMQLAASKAIVDSQSSTSMISSTISQMAPKELTTISDARRIEVMPVSNQVETPTRPTTSTAEKPFSFRSSAYVQNLAEICHTIIHDQRWKTEGITRQPLFVWENGEDLKATLILSQLYLPKPKETSKCTCLLCREINIAEPHLSNVITCSNSKRDAIRHQDDGEVDDDDDRAKNLFCRLYYRKGPWFRLDDIYSRYYAPKLMNLSELSMTNSEIDYDEGDNPGPRVDATNDINRDIYEAVFSEGNKDEKTMSNEDHLQKNILAMKDLIADIGRLKFLGLIRGFESEEECGKAAGSVHNEGHGVLLNADERQSILQKLGGSKKKSNGWKINHASGGMLNYRQNEIWKQMSQQKSIFSLAIASNGSNPKLLLPVCHHVNHEVFSKLAACVAHGANAVEFLSTAVLNANLTQVKTEIHAIVNASKQSLDLPTCFCLQDAPLNTLRRFCRLFLCATSGPGDMRGDITNGWKSLMRSPPSNDIPFVRLIPPPGINSWHSIRYPGLSSRFNLTYHSFKLAHNEMKFCNDSDVPMVQVFQNVNAFRLWEFSVELRAFVDYQVELNAMILYQDRRKQRGTEIKEQEISRNGEGTSVNEKSDFKTDFLNLLYPFGRLKLIFNLMAFNATSTVVDSKETTRSLYDEVERTLSMFEGLSQPESASDVNWTNINGNSLHTECEKVIFVCAIIVTKVLEQRHLTISIEDMASMKARPWLRHLWWEGVLSYVLWDCIPILEKRGFYDLACKALEVLVFGSTQSQDWKSSNKLSPEECSRKWGSSVMPSRSVPFCEYLISRRARGKAQERLMVDYVHLHRSEGKIAVTNNVEVLGGQHHRKLKRLTKGLKDGGTDKVKPLCSILLSRAAKSAAIPFSALRSLARRLKQPLVELLDVSSSLEASIFRFRLGSSPTDQTETKSGYNDWSPVIDEAIAVALATEKVTAGKRCSYIGFEENEMAEISSLNVEQLATEYYASGRLPRNNPELEGGGWVGWHDEGGHLRALFRILCAGPILGMGNGCGGLGATPTDATEMLTIHLTPYQGAPFDLHVGSWTHYHGSDKSDHSFSVRGFFARRKKSIDRYLDCLEQLDSQSISDLVFDIVKSRLDDHLNHQQQLKSDVALSRDVQQLRTLCMLAAGFGGAQLAAAFRCMLFDYRHYSGGLPDLLLARALYDGEKSPDAQLVNLGDWIGESFSPEAQLQKDALRRAAILIDRDDEYLGCNKMGDSATGALNRWGRPKLLQQSRDMNTTFPEPLRLVHKCKSIKIQCMFVEVKSLNDRLDGRQEDWLNLLDRLGNARVCKFVNSNTKRYPKTKQVPSKSNKSRKCTEASDEKVLTN